MSTPDLEGAASRPEPGSAAPELGGGFTAGTAGVNGTTIHYVRGGHGPALVLLHGFPQDWFEWRRVMPRLSQRFTVIAVDLRDVSRLHPHRHGPGDPVPGIEPWLNLNVDVPLWHGAFHMIPGLPEALVTDRQAVYFRYFFDIGTKDNTVISDADLKHYADAYGDPGRLRSAFEIYRALPANMTYNAAQTGPTGIPLLLAGGEHVFWPVLPPLADNLRANYGWSDIEVRLVADGKHYLPEERPDDIAELIENHAGQQIDPAGTSSDRATRSSPGAAASA
jgi:pimeloyl-ACP methyl ester carboxylesterase